MRIVSRFQYLVLVAWLSGCGGSDSDNSPKNNAPRSVQPSSTVVLISAIAYSAPTPTHPIDESRITLNNPWSNATADYENAWWCFDAICGIWAYLAHQGIKFTTWKTDYEQKLAECQSYAGETVDGENICVPTNNTNISCAVTSMLEYGYYCGAGRPATGFWGKEPLDGVDYCCKLHDQRIWDTRPGLSLTIESNNACGVIMCLYTETEYPAGASSEFSETESARQCLHDWAAYACYYNQSNDSPPPTVEINP